MVQSIARSNCALSISTHHTYHCYHLCFFTLSLLSLDKYMKKTIYTYSITFFFNFTSHHSVSYTLYKNTKKYYIINLIFLFTHKFKGFRLPCISKPIYRLTGHWLIIGYTSLGYEILRLDCIFHEKIIVAI